MVVPSVFVVVLVPPSDAVKLYVPDVLFVWVLASSFVIPFCSAHSSLTSVTSFQSFDNVQLAESTVVLDIVLAMEVACSWEMVVETVSDFCCANPATL